LLYYPLVGETSAERKYAHNVVMLLIVAAAGAYAIRRARRCAGPWTGPRRFVILHDIPRLGQTIPALPVRAVPAAAAFYRDRFGFTIAHEDTGFAIVIRDAAEIHLWSASDETCGTRGDLASIPVCSGAESFIAGTASCRIAVEGVDELYAELRASAVLHSPSTVVEDTDYGTREFPALDGDGNLISFYTRLRPRPD
jgi:catechol 2,3-dioxygenase-like lactoylglutathione lyase family enzyme